MKRREFLVRVPGVMALVGMLNRVPAKSATFTTTQPQKKSVLFIYDQDGVIVDTFDDWKPAVDGTAVAEFGPYGGDVWVSGYVLKIPGWGLGDVAAWGNTNKLLAPGDILTISFGVD